MEWATKSPVLRLSRFLKSKPIVFASTSLGASLMHSVFQFYYVKVYVDHYHIPESWFNWMQMIYMLWNAINDPLLGYCQDHWHGSIVRSRRHTILYGAPLWALTFLLPWFPWASFEDTGWLCGLHLVIALCAYDTLFTHVLLANGCVWAEMAESEEDRIKFYYYGAIASLIGSSSVLFCETFSNHLSNFHSFQICCVIIAILAWVAVSHTGRYAITKYDLISVKGNHTSPRESNISDQVLSSDRATEFSVIQLILQILSQRNFLCFVLMNFFNEFHVNFVASMSRVISEALVSDQVSSAIWVMYCGAIMILPRMMQVILFPVLSRYGYYRVYCAIFILVTVCSSLMFIIGDGHPWIFMAYTMADSVLSGGKSSLTGLPLSDIIDEDCKTHNRRHPVSSMVFGTNALITKPAISLGPMLAMRILNFHNYKDYRNSTISTKNLIALKHSMFTLSCLLPFCVGIIQYLFMSQYKAKKSHIKLAKYTDA